MAPNTLTNKRRGVYNLFGNDNKPREIQKIECWSTTLATQNQDKIIRDFVSDLFGGRSAAAAQRWIAFEGANSTGRRTGLVKNHHVTHGGADFIALQL